MNHATGTFVGIQIVNGKNRYEMRKKVNSGKTGNRESCWEPVINQELLRAWAS